MMHDETQAPKWRVNMLRRPDGGMDIRLFIEDKFWTFPALEAHKLGSALHAAAMPELERQDGIDTTFGAMINDLMPPENPSAGAPEDDDA